MSSCAGWTLPKLNQNCSSLNISKVPEQNWTMLGQHWQKVSEVPHSKFGWILLTRSRVIEGGHILLGGLSQIWIQIALHWISPMCLNRIEPCLVTSSRRCQGFHTPRLVEFSSPEAELLKEYTFCLVNFVKSKLKLLTTECLQSAWIELNHAWSALAEGVRASTHQVWLNSVH
jgi:hypothetical protein